MKNDLFKLALVKLREIQDTLNSSWLDLVCTVLTNDIYFITWPSSMNKHHTFQYGNFIHSVEVLELAIKQATTINIHRENRGDTQLDLEVLAISAMLHDYGKIYTYEKDFKGFYKKIPFYTKSLHIYKSIDKAYELLKGYDKTNKVIQCIGAHHGRLDYGALWEPKSPEDWVLHLADMSSVFGIENRINNE